MRCSWVVLCALACVMGWCFGMCHAGVREEAQQYVAALRADTKDPAELARKILAAAKSLGGNVPLQAALYEQAYEHAAGTAKAQDTAIAVLEALVAIGGEKQRQWQRKLLAAIQIQSRRSRGMVRSRLAERSVDLMLAVARSYLDSGEPEAGLRLIRQAKLTVQRERTWHGQGIVDLLARATMARELGSQVARLQAQVKASPAASKPRSELLRILVVERDRPDQAQALLTPAVAESWRTYVPMALKAPADLAPEACGELGHWYWQHVQTATALGRPRMRRRAETYYRRYVASNPKPGAMLLTATDRLKQLTRWRAADEHRMLGMVCDRITAPHKVGHSCQVWQILPEYAVGKRYRICMDHAASGPAGAFILIAFADTVGDGRPDKLIGMSPLRSATRVGQWSSWEFQATGKAVFVGNCWKKPPQIHYQPSHPKGYEGLSPRMYVGRSVGQAPREAVMHRYTNIRVEILE